MAVGNIKRVEIYRTDDFKPCREFLNRLYKIIIKKPCDGKVVKW